MMFEEEDATQATAQDVYGKVAAFLKAGFKYETYETEQWYKDPVSKLTPYGPLARSGNAHSMFEGKKIEKWNEINKALDDVIKVVNDEFIPQLTTWVVEKYPEIEPSERDSSSEDIQWAITSILGFSTAWGQGLRTNYNIKKERFDAVCKEQYPPFLDKLDALSALAQKCIDLYASTGHFGEQWTRWFLFLIYVPITRDKTYGSHDVKERPPRHHPSTILSIPFVKYTFEQFATNPVAIAYASRDAIFSYLNIFLWSDIKYIMDYPDQAAAVRPAAMNNLVAVMAIMDNFVSLFTNVHYAVFKPMVELTGTVAWLTGFYSCNAIKAKEMNFPYDQFASRLAEYILWCGCYADNGAYRATYVNILENIFIPFDVFSRQICLSKQSLEFITPTYDYFVAMGDGVTDQLKMVEPKTLKPKLPDLIALPTNKQIDDWYQCPTTAFENDDHHQEWTERAHSFAAAIAKGEPITPGVWAKEAQVTSPMTLFQHQAKKVVDASKIFGKIQYVTGGVYDYRVKIVTSGDADTTVKVITANKSTFNPGEWRIVTAFPDFKLKVVTTGTFDFSVKIQ